jgi:hypothetical protein
MKKELRIGKLEAARRQLETAIKLYFHYSDPISIHTLSAAAYNVLRAINKDHGGTPMFAKEFLVQHIAPGQEKHVMSQVNEAENFFKHADRDPDKVLHFKLFLTEIFLLDACGKYHDLTGELVPVFQVFFYWVIIHHPKLFKLPAEAQMLAEGLQEDLSSLSRQDFFRVALPFAVQQNTPTEGNG